MSFSPANITALIVAASFSAGLNIYATVLTLGILARTQWVPLPPGLESLGNTWVLVICAIMFAIEFVVDKIPAFDMAWNFLHTIVRVPIAGLIAYNASAHLSPPMQILATAIGTTIAFATHTSKTAIRAAVTPSPEPISNIALSTAEDTLAIGLTWFATHHPVIAASAALIFLAAGILGARALLRAVHRPLQRILHPDTAPKPPV